MLLVLVLDLESLAAWTLYLLLLAAILVQCEVHCLGVGGAPTARNLTIGTIVDVLLMVFFDNNLIASTVCAWLLTLFAILFMLM